MLALITQLLWPVDTEGPDALTSLPRLRRFEHFLDGAIGRTRHGLARGGVLVAIDLDRFGPINKDPLLDQAIGDEVLAEIGRRLRSQARTGDAVARPGGDEFAGFFAGTFDPESAVRLGERLLKEIRRPVVTSAGIVEVGASIGLVIVEPGPGLPDNAALMKRADVTMQAVKRDGGGVRLFGVRYRRADGPKVRLHISRTSDIVRSCLIVRSNQSTCEPPTTARAPVIPTPTSIGCSPSSTA